MVPPRKEVRSWRAWACWSFSREIFPDDPADEKQIAEEGVIEPSRDEIAGQLERCGLTGEAELWQSVLDTI